MRERRLILPYAAAAAAFLIHLLLNPGYGFFRDELYFIICGRHPAFGYVDQPPVIPLLSAFSQIFGTSLVALRAVAALFSAASIFVTCRIVQEFDGGPFAEMFAAVAAFFAPVLLSYGGKVSTDSPGLWLWPLAVLYVIRIVKGADPRWWLAAGAALGISCESKYSVLFFIAALIAGLAIAPERRFMRSPWFFGGIALAAAIALPNFAWQAAHQFPMLELLRNGQTGKNVILSPPQYLFAQLLLLNPVLAVAVIAGFVWLIVRTPFRWLAYTYAILMVMMIAAHGKDYYPADVYPYLFAAGAVPIERWTRRGAFVLRPAALAVAAAAGVWLLPFVLPVLPDARFIAYSGAVESALHLHPTQNEHHRPAAMGQDFADMHGWPELTATVARVYDSLSPADRARAVIKTGNYGEASALNFFGKRYGLPPAISGHNQYFLWGTRGYTGDVLIDVGGDCGAREHFFRESRLGATFTAPYVMPYEDRMPIMVCRGIKEPLADVWPLMKDYN